MATSIPSRGAKTLPEYDVRKMNIKKKILAKKTSAMSDVLTGRALVEGVKVVGRVAAGTVRNMTTSVGRTEKLRRKVNGQR